jgi:AraC-like DNA-binding protein
MEKDLFAYKLLFDNEQIYVSGARTYSWNTERHNNAAWELHLLLKGKCNIDVDDQHLLLQQGQFILIAPGQYHRPKAIPGEFERFSFSFTPETPSLRRQFQDKCHRFMIFTAEPSLCALVQKIILEGSHSLPFHSSCQQALLTQFMIALFRLLDLTNPTAERPKRRASTTLTGRIDDYFEQNFASAAGEQVLADKLHVSRRHLIRLLSEHYGMTFRQKLINTRMDYAAWLLRTSNMNISQIGSFVGYNSEAAFFRVFRQHFHMTPKQYRSIKNAGVSK